MTADYQSRETTIWIRDVANEICICGVGARTAVGLSATATAAAVRAGISGLAKHPTFVDEAGEQLSFASDPLLDVGVPLLERLAEMGASAAREALPPESKAVDCCWLALSTQDNGLDPEFSSVVASTFAERAGLAAVPLRTIARGHASGLIAVQSAADLITRGRVRSALVVGVDSYHDSNVIAALERDGRLTTSVTRGGFLPGEGAGACLLTDAEFGRRAQLPLMATVVAAATALEPAPRRSLEPCIGTGLTAALSGVIAGLQLPVQRISDAYCDLNGERYRSEEFMFALLRTQDAFIDPHDYTSPADCWGDVGAASGPLFAVLAVSAGLREYATGPVSVLWTGSDEGHRSAVALALRHP